MSTKKRGLGKGLSALLQNSETDITSNQPIDGNIRVAGTVAGLAISTIEANPFQPRTKFEKEALAELAASIKEHGIIQPVTVRKLGFDKYQLISGERRFRASQLAGLTEIPAYIRIADDQSMLEMALIENIQRENLDAIEVSLSYQRLIDECKLTQEELGERVGKKRATVTNYLRLLKLPAEVQLGIRDRKISMGHARALLGSTDAKDQLKFYRKILSDDLSVRATEALIKERKQAARKPKKGKAALSLQQQKYRDDLAKQFDTKIDLSVNDKGGGKIVINFNSEDDLERLVDLFDI